MWSLAMRGQLYDEWRGKSLRTEDGRPPLGAATMGGFRLREMLCEGTLPWERRAHHVFRRHAFLMVDFERKQRKIDNPPDLECMA
jgi:hypothetical protein